MLAVNTVACQFWTMFVPFKMGFNLVFDIP
jgi:hypothetical protein